MTFQFEMENVDGEPAGTFTTAEPRWRPGDEVLLRPGERLLIREVLVPTAAGFAGRWRVEPLRL
jgi:hypothetical protein